MIIGISGYARSGKDTIAGILAADGFARIAFADAIREALYRVNPMVELKDGSLTDLALVVDDRGWEVAKTLPEVRGYLQRLGTEVGRDMMGEDVWVNVVLRRMVAGENYVITDVRYPNEATAIVRAGGRVWRVERPGFGPANSHVSETSMDGWICDAVIVNDGSLEDLERKVREAL